MDNEAILLKGDNVRLSNGVFEQGKNFHTTPQWVKNISDFQKVPLSEVFSELERQYGISTILVGVDGRQLFTGGFAHNNLDEALKAITIPLDLDYVVLENGNVRVMPSEK